MTDPLRPRARGERVRPPDLARDEAVLAATRQVLGGSPAVIGGPMAGMQIAQGIILPFVNNVVIDDGTSQTDTDLVPGNAIGLGSMVDTASADLPKFLGGIVLEGLAPSLEDHLLGGWAICMDIVPFGGMGRALVYGVIQARIKWFVPPDDIGFEGDELKPYQDHLYVGITDNEVMLESRPGGAARILYSNPADEDETESWVLLAKGM